MGIFVENFFRGGEHGLGWTPDHPDPNDERYQRVLSANIIPNETFLRRLYPTCFQPVVEDQGQTSSCVGNALGTGLEFCWAKQKQQNLNFSRMAIYALARKRRGWLHRDIGSFIRDAAYQIQAVGVCLESFHPFRMDYLFKDLDQYALEQSARHRIQNVRRVERQDVIEVIANHSPVVGGITVFRECVFGEEAQRTGYIRLPRRGDSFGGGHAILIEGYSLSKGIATGPNSWSSEWGDNGWYSMPLDYINNPDLSDDFWTFDVV